MGFRGTVVKKMGRSGLASQEKGTIIPEDGEDRPNTLDAGGP